MKYKAIIYDFDGVICDSVNVKTEAFAAMYQQYGQAIVDKVVAYHLEHGGISRYEKFKYWHKEFLGINLTEEEIQKLGKEFSDLALQKVVDSSYIPGAFDFLKTNSLKYKQFICTGTPDIEIHTILKLRELSNYFVGVYGSPRTKTEIIHLILDQNKLHRDEVLFFGDAMTDYKAAKECNISFIGIESDHTEFPPNTEVSKDFISLKELF